MIVRRGYKLSRFRFLRVLRTVRKFCPPERESTVTFTINEARHLFDHGEEGIGLEILIGNLHEIEFLCSSSLFKELQWLAERFTIDSRYRHLLDHLVA